MIVPVFFKVCRVLCPAYLFLCLVAVSVLFSPLPARGGDARYLDALISAAEGKKLFSDPYWDILVHYQPDGDGKESLVDDPAFFLSPHGKTDPTAELRATIEGLFSDPASGDEHPQCRFVARAAWLKEQLEIDEQRLPAARCAKYEEAMANITMRSATLAFPAAHGNGPASMFGHTLIRIDSPFQSDLLSYAVNYAAKSDDSSGFVYTFKGIFGLFRGYYSILPYYKKVNEYNQIEHRDIWEYSLNLTEREVRRMVMHIWELRNVYSDYYFFTENCSFNLLYLLEAARPSARLADRFRGRVRFWVIPSDTVRVVVDAGLVDRVAYRPSLATRIETLKSGMNSDDQRTTLAVVNDEAAAAGLVGSELSDERKRRVLDLAAEVVQYRYSRKYISRDEYLKQFLAVLNARSAVGGTGTDPAAAAVAPTSPDRGHLPGRIGAGLGQRGREYFAEFSWRPAYHDLLDPPQGYVKGAQINFFDIRGRVYADEGSAKLHSFRVLDIVSLAPRDRFFKPVSWKVLVGFDRSVLDDDKDHLVFRLSPGGGAAYDSRIFGLSYVMLDSDLQLSGAIDHGWSAGVGGSVGIFRPITAAWNVNLSGKALFYPLGDQHRSLSGLFRQSVTLGTNASVEMTVQREKTYNHYRTDAVVSVNFYY